MSSLVSMMTKKLVKTSQYYVGRQLGFCGFRPRSVHPSRTRNHTFGRRNPSLTCQTWNFRRAPSSNTIDHHICAKKRCSSDLDGNWTTNDLSSCTTGSHLHFTCTMHWFWWIFVRFKSVLASMKIFMYNARMYTCIGSCKKKRRKYIEEYVRVRVIYVYVHGKEASRYGSVPSLDRIQHTCTYVRSTSRPWYAYTCSGAVRIIFVNTWWLRLRGRRRRARSLEHSGSPGRWPAQKERS